MERKPDLSIVVPLFNEEEGIPALLAELKRVTSMLGRSYEIVLIDDGSTDATAQLLEQASQTDQNIKVLRFSRNFGHQAAFSAGIDFAQGQMVITMDGDLQHPPAMLPTFLAKADEGYDIVIGERLANKQNSKKRELANKWFYKFLTLITNLEFRNVSDFALYNHSVVAVLKRLPEKERYLRGLVQWVGFRKAYVSYAVDERKFGVPKYNFQKLLKLVLSGVTSFSAFPLRLALWAGILVFLASFIFGVYVAIDHYVNPNPLIPGWATVVILILFFSSIQLIVLGIVGEYLYKMFNEVKGRPLYIVAQTHNIDKANTDASAYGIHP